MSRDLDDSDSFPAGAVGPTMGDDANGDEISEMGDPLMMRTRWAGNRLAGAYMLIDYVTSYTASGADVAAPTGTTYVNFGTITGNVVLELGDLIEVYSEYHWYGDGSGTSLILNHAMNITPASLETLSNSPIERDLSSGDTGFSMLVTWSSTFVAVAGQVGYVPQVKHRAKLSGAGADFAVQGASFRSIKVWRQNPTVPA